jgi:uncharacterized protein YabE (DUF348 family)
MNKLFKEDNTEMYMEKFEIIIDRAKNESMAKSNAVDFYLTLMEDEEVELDTEQIIDIAESYGYDFSDFEELIENTK